MTFLKRKIEYTLCLFNGVRELAWTTVRRVITMGGDTDYQGAEIGASESTLYQRDGYNMLTLPYL
jgi:hypothetical protein